MGIFCNNRLWILISTDLMGGDSDFNGVNLVIDYHFPQSSVSHNYSQNWLVLLL